MAGHGFVAVVGARALPEAFATQVAEVVEFFLSRGWGIASGGAPGADTFALRAAVAAGPAACAHSVVFLPGPVPAGDAVLQAFLARGGGVVVGRGGGRAALLARSRQLVREAAGVVAFLWGPSRGSVYTVREAVWAGKPAAVVLAGGGAVLPLFPDGRWVPCSLGPVAAFRWVPVRGSRDEEPGPRRASWLARVFGVPEGEPTHTLLAHISSLSQGERLWFERAVVLGDTVVVPHEAVSDTPAFLALPRLMRRFRCGAREAADLAELLLALDASPAIVAHYQAEALRVGVAELIGDLVHLVASLALIEAEPDADALDHAEALGADVDEDDGGGRVVHDLGKAGGMVAQALVQWHALGAMHPELVTCRVCGARYEVADDAAETPTCPACGAPDTWETRQDPAFRTLVAEIDGAGSLDDLAAVGKRLYAFELPHDQAGVAWSHYHLRRARLEAAIELGAPARALLTRIGVAPAVMLPRLGARLYRLQRARAVAASPTEWRRIWAAYHARRGRSA